MSFDAIQQLMKSSMGLTPESVGVESIKRVVARRMKELGLDQVEAYLSRLKGSAEERQTLINEVTVPETWFFRDHEPFNALADFVQKLRISRNKQCINILSVPCSTGEEPYSIAMVLRDSGFGKADFCVDAVDISTRVLEKARKGVYSQNSFRSKDVRFRDKYFVPCEGGYEIASDIKAAVHFQQGNVVAPNFVAGKPLYDVVFCRNLLIYFDFQTKCRVLNTLHGLMVDGALLVLGHAETGRMPPGLFAALSLPGAFAYVKEGATDSPSKVPRLPEPAKLPQRRANHSPRPKVSAPATPKSIKPVAQKPVSDQATTDGDQESWIDTIHKLADQGRLDEALTECDKFIQAVPDSAQGYYVKALVLLGFDADSEAMDAFKKAVYLDPKHYQSLIHLSVLAEEHGDQRAADNFRARADRLRDGGHVGVV